MNKLKVFDLYCDGEKVGNSLYWNELQEIIREYKKYYAELGIKPKFKWIEV